MNDRIRLKITRIGIDNYGEPHTVNIRAVVDTLDPLKTIAERFRQASERTIPAQLLFSWGAPRSVSPSTISVEDLEQVIVEGLVGMKHSGQIAREIIRRFGGQRLAEEA